LIRKTEGAFYRSLFQNPQEFNALKDEIKFVNDGLYLPWNLASHSNRAVRELLVDPRKQLKKNKGVPSEARSGKVR